MITEKDARAGAARDMGLLAELDFQIRDNHKLTSEVMRLDDENAKLRDWCSELLHMAESHDPEWFHWPEVYEELRGLGVEVDV